MSEIDTALERLSVDYPAVVSTLEAAELRENDGMPIPSLEAAAFGVTPHVAEFLNSRAESGLSDKLVIAPNLGKLTLEQFLGATGHRIVDNGYYNSRFSHEPRNHNRGKVTSPWSIGVVLSDTKDEKGTPLRHTGLVFPGRSFERQKTLAAIERQKLKRSHKVDVQPITIQEQIIAKLTYSDLRSGTTRFVHLPTPNVFLPAMGKGPGLLGVLISVGGHPGAPELTGNSINFTTSSFHKGDEDSGVRRVLMLNGLDELNRSGTLLKTIKQLGRGRPELTA